MHTYKLRAYTADGSVEFTVQIRAEDDASALGRVGLLPLRGRCWDLYRGERLVRRLDPSCAAA